jgi:predicted nucleic acid-binding protein
MEVYYISLREEGRAEADRRYALIRHLEAEILWDMNEQVLLIAARLKAEHHVSLADAIVAAYAIQHKAVLIHKDPEFEALAGLLPMEALPYKSK